MRKIVDMRKNNGEPACFICKRYFLPDEPVMISYLNRVPVFVHPRHAGVSGTIISHKEAKELSCHPEGEAPK